MLVPYDSEEVDKLLLTFRSAILMMLAGIEDYRKMARSIPSRKARWLKELREREK